MLYIYKYINVYVNIKKCEGFQFHFIHTPCIPVLAQARRGEFHEVVSAPIIPALLDGGVVFVLRWALDDATDNSMAASVHALHALLVCEEDEVSWKGLWRTYYYLRLRKAFVSDHHVGP